MTESQQVQNITQLGYSPREAAFLRLVALHSGYFLRRQYTLQRGQLDNVLCERVLRHKHCTQTTYNGKTELYHLHSKTVYGAIGEPENRHRRAHKITYLRTKLMGLDYALTHPELRFLPTEASKLEYFCGELSLDKSLLPVRLYHGKDGTSSPCYFIEKYPVYSNPSTGKTGICYLDDGLYTPDGFGNWLFRHKPLIEALGSRVEVVYVTTHEESGAIGAEKEFDRVIRSLPVEMLRYFEQERDVELNGLAGRDKAWLDAFRDLRGKYGGPDGHYPDWRKGNARKLETAATLKLTALPYSYKCLPKTDKKSGGMSAAAV